MPSEATQFKPKHGHAKPNDPTYVCWWSMRQRCEYEPHKSYARYGGRGIKVCAEWQDFANFLRDMGERPPGLTLGRIDNERNYEPGNVRWETMKEQQNNRSSNRVLTAFGKSQTVTQWADETGIPRSTIEKRLDQMKWPVDEAVSIKVGERTRWSRSATSA
jgi:hypothetical protein